MKYQPHLTKDNQLISRPPTVPSLWRWGSPRHAEAAITITNNTTTDSRPPAVAMAASPQEK